MKRPYRAWDPARDDTFICKAVFAPAPDVATVVLAPALPSVVCFEAGQHVTVEFDVGGQGVNRCYTIASPPTRPERIALTVKRTRRGTVSGWLNDGGLIAGARVRVGGPHGEFTMAAHPAASTLLLTAGSGITPALSMLRTLYDLATAADVVLVHSERTLARVPYREEIELMARHLPGLRVRLLCTGIGSAGKPGRTEVAGRLDDALLARLVPDAAAREVFVCGPPGYQAAARAAVLAAGVPSSRVHEESFSFTGPPGFARSVRQHSMAVAGAYRVELQHLGVTLECPPGLTVLDAAVAAGVELPFSCREGLCGTCKSTLLAGEVDMRHNGGIRPGEIAAGKVLLCCSRPLTDLVIAA